jgi:iron complex transport system substrate-binding protein
MRRVILILTLVAASACGGGSGTTSATVGTPAATTSAVATTSPVEAFPVTVEGANGPVTIQEQPDRIVSLSPTATEIVFAIDAGDRVVAVDEFSTYPEEAPITDLSGFEPNVEAVAGYEPDLVVVSDDFNDVVAGLTALGIPVLHQPAAAVLDDTYDQIEQLGQATGNADEAFTLVTTMQAEISALQASVPEFAEAPTYYHELDSSFFSVTSGTFIGEVYAMAGLENIADAAEGAETLYPQLSGEFILDADPDLIFLADTKCCGESADTVLARPGWDQLTAVANGGVVSLDDDVASRWGPRVVDFFTVIVEEVSSLPAAA